MVQVSSISRGSALWLGRFRYPGPSPGRDDLNRDGLERHMNANVATIFPPKRNSGQEKGCGYGIVQCSA